MCHRELATAHTGLAAVLAAIGPVTVGLGLAALSLPLTSSAVVNLTIACSLGMFADVPYVSLVRAGPRMHGDFDRRNLLRA